MDSLGSVTNINGGTVFVGGGGGGGATLRDIAAKVASLISGHRNGGLLASLVVIPLEDNWEARFQREAGGKTFSQWLHGFSGVRAQDWRSYFRAATALGKETAARWDTGAAVWVVNKFDGDGAAMSAILGAVRSEWKARAKGDRSYPPLSQDVVERIVLDMFPSEPKQKRKCARCAQLEELLRAAGIDVPVE